MRYRLSKEIDAIHLPSIFIGSMCGALAGFLTSLIVSESKGTTTFVSGTTGQYTFISAINASFSSEVLFQSTTRDIQATTMVTGMTTFVPLVSGTTINSAYTFGNTIACGSLTAPLISGSTITGWIVYNNPIVPFGNTFAVPYITGTTIITTTAGATEQSNFVFVNGTTSGQVLYSYGSTLSFPALIGSTCPISFAFGTTYISSYIGDAFAGFFLSCIYL